MKSPWVAFLFASATAAAVAAILYSKAQLPADVLHGQLAVGEETRHFRLVVPHGVDAKRAIPVVFAFHGAGDTPEQMAQYTGLDDLAVAHNFYLVYPQGRFQSWPPAIYAENSEPVERELAFFDAILEDMSGRYTIDGERVYAVGMSQGAAFVELLVAKRNSCLAAAVSHSGWLPEPLSSEGWTVDFPCPILLIAGAADRQVTPTMAERARDCFERKGHPTELLIIPELGHRWARDHDINQRIWQFLSPRRLGEQTKITMKPPKCRCSHSQDLFTTTRVWMAFSRRKTGARYMEFGIGQIRMTIVV